MIEYANLFTSTKMNDDEVAAVINIRYFSRMKVQITASLPGCKTLKLFSASLTIIERHNIIIFVGVRYVTSGFSLGEIKKNTKAY